MLFPYMEKFCSPRGLILTQVNWPREGCLRVRKMHALSAFAVRLLDVLPWGNYCIF